MLNDINKQAEIDLQLMLRRNNLEDIVTALCKDIRELFTFAYELRKLDVDDLYTESFLNGQVRPHTLVQLILENKWCP